MRTSRSTCAEARAAAAAAATDPTARRAEVEDADPVLPEGRWRVAAVEGAAATDPSPARLLGIAAVEGGLGGLVPALIFHPLLELTTPWGRLLPPALTAWCSTATAIALLGLLGRLGRPARFDPTQTCGLLLGVIAASLFAGTALGLAPPLLAPALIGPSVVLGLWWIGGPYPARLRRTTLSLVHLAFLVHLTLDPWPLRASVHLSRPALDALAAELRAGNPVATPTRAGSLIVHRAALRGTVPCLVLDPDPSGPKQLAQLAGDPSGTFNLWAARPVADGWWWIDED